MGDLFEDKFWITAQFSLMELDTVERDGEMNINWSFKFDFPGLLELIK
jgi:hypothetical protein